MASRHVDPPHSALAALAACAAWRPPPATAERGHRDAQTQAAVTSAELAIRFELTANQPTTVSVLGFRAAAAGAATVRRGRHRRPRPGGSPRRPPRPRTAASCATSTWPPTRSAHAAGRSISRSWAASVSAWAPAPARDGDHPPLPPRLSRTWPAWSPASSPRPAPQPLAALPEQVSLFSPEAELPVDDARCPGAAAAAGDQRLRPDAGRAHRREPAA